MPRCLPLLLELLWMLTPSQASDTILLYPTIIWPRNITMGFATFVNFRCELNISAGSASEVFWLHGGVRLSNDSRHYIRLENPANGQYISYLEVRDLEPADAGRYTCDATARLNNLNTLRIIPDNVYLSLADYQAAHWGEPCKSLSTKETCLDANTGCYPDRRFNKTGATGNACQCKYGFPIHIPQFSRCDTGAHLGGSCVDDSQCTWFTQYAVCRYGYCQCADAYVTSQDGTECNPVIPEGKECSMDWECERSGMLCMERQCRYKVVVSGGQIAVLVLLSVIGFCLLVYLVILLVRRSRQKKKMQYPNGPPIYIVPLRT